MQRSWKRPHRLGLYLAGAIAAGWLGYSAAESQFVQPAPTIPKELTSYRDIVKQVVPAVVSIEPKAKFKKNESRAIQPDLPDGIPEQFRRYFEQQQMQQFPNPRLGFGSGFIVDPTGVILTAA